MKKNIVLIVVAVVIAGGAFYGGMRYAAAKRATAFAARGGNGSSTFPGGFGRGGMRGMGSGFAVGDVISKDPTGITIKLPNGSSEIVLTSSSTTVMKAAPGTLDDVQTGNTVSVQGTMNADGSVTAQSIQLRPALPAGMNGSMNRQ
jgi:hypothetical protein